MTKLVEYDNNGGAIYVETLTEFPNGKTKLTERTYVMKKGHHGPVDSIEIWQTSEDAPFIEDTGFYIYGDPNMNVHVYAANTDMPKELAEALVATAYPFWNIKHVFTIAGMEPGLVTSFEFALSYKEHM